MGVFCFNHQKIQTTVKLTICGKQQEEPINANDYKQSISEQFECSIWDLHKLRQQFNKKNREEGYKYVVRSEIMTNHEQINNLQWKGQYGLSDQKVGKWIAIWKGETLKDVGGWQSQKGNQIFILEQWRKIGLMGRYNQELLEVKFIQQFLRNAQIYQTGEYMNDKKQGQWKYLYKNREIGGGCYNIDNIKIGKWIELSDNYQQFSQICYQGEYKKGKKVGLWNIFYGSQDNKQIGGGLYDEGIKIGRWVDLSDGFYLYSQITYIGEYHYGKKVGRWSIVFLDYYTNNYEQIGGGSYDQGGDNIKIGRWIELSEGFWRDSQVTYNGEYKNGKKVGNWDIWYSERDRNLKKKELIGGGSYNEEGDEIKIGKWTEQSDGYLDRSQVTYNGNYKNGKKEGRWDILFYNRLTNKNELIGGGSYDQGCDGIKIGKWIELSDDFHECSQVTHVGEYKNGQKDGRWDIWYKNRDTKINELIGGGSFDEANDGLKIGKWIELNDWFLDSSQVTNNGQYKNGKKDGRWDIWYKNRDTKINELIGGGSYNEEGDSIKVGMWIELNEGFWDYSQVTYRGEYKNSKKVGRWEIKYEGQLIGGGSYDEEGDGIKVECGLSQQVVYYGQYQSGKKVGTWVEAKREWDRKEFIKKGELKYNN